MRLSLLLLYYEDIGQDQKQKLWNKMSSRKQRNKSLTVFVRSVLLPLPLQLDIESLGDPLLDVGSQPRCSVLLKVNLVSTKTGFVDIVIQRKRDHLISHHPQAARSVDIVQDRLRLWTITSTNNRANDYSRVGGLSGYQGSQLLDLRDDMLWLLLNVVCSNVDYNSLVRDTPTLGNVLDSILQLVSEGFFR